MRKPVHTYDRAGVTRYVANMGLAVPNIIRLGTLTNGPFTRDTIRFYGFYEYTGWSGFLRKVLMGIKARINDGKAS